MKRFVTQRNIERYRALLAGTTDVAARLMLGKLLAEEEAKLADLDAEACAQRAEFAAPPKRRHLHS